MKKQLLTALGVATLTTVGLTVPNASAAPAEPTVRTVADAYGPDYFGCTDAPHIVVHQGSQGESVRLLQCLLNNYIPGSPDIAVDGIFGPRTAEAVLRFKRVFFGRATDSIVGPNTWDALLWPCVCGWS